MSPPKTWETGRYYPHPANEETDLRRKANGPCSGISWIQDCIFLPRCQCGTKRKVLEAEVQGSPRQRCKVIFWSKSQGSRATLLIFELHAHGPWVSLPHSRIQACFLSNSGSGSAATIPWGPPLSGAHTGQPQWQHQEDCISLIPTSTERSHGCLVPTGAAVSLMWATSLLSRGVRPHWGQTPHSSRTGLLGWLSVNTSRVLAWATTLAVPLLNTSSLVQ